MPQIQYNQIGHIACNSVMATAWPCPGSWAPAESHLPVLTVPMNRASQAYIARERRGVPLAAGNH